MQKDKIIFHGCARLAEVRGTLFETQEAAAEAFGVTRVTWGKYERGEAIPKGEVFQALALRGIDVMYILTGQRTGVAVAAPPAPELSPRKAALLEHYDRTSEDGKKIIEATAHAAAQPASRRGKAA